MFTLTVEPCRNVERRTRERVRTSDNCRLGCTELRTIHDQLQVLEVARKRVPFTVTVTVLTFTPSAEAAVRAYEPISWFARTLRQALGAKAVFCAAVKLEFESVRALPFAPDELSDWLEIWPCKLFWPDSESKFAVTVWKLAVDWMSALSDKTRVVFAGMT